MAFLGISLRFPESNLPLHFSGPSIYLRSDFPNGHLWPSSHRCIKKKILCLAVACLFACLPPSSHARLPVLLPPSLSLCATSVRHLRGCPTHVLLSTTPIASPNSVSNVGFVCLDRNVIHSVCKDSGSILVKHSCSSFGGCVGKLHRLARYKTACSSDQSLLV